MFDYELWTVRCAKFIKQLSLDDRAIVRSDNGVVLELPTAEDIQKIEARIGRALPQPLRDFSAVLGGLDMRYSWCPKPEFRKYVESELGNTNLYGGPSQFAVIGYLWQWWDRVQSWAKSVKYANGHPSQDYLLWRNALPILCTRNGDYLALDLRDSSEDPPLVYLSHDEDLSPQIAPNLEAFLTDWERACYIGPEIWMLEDFAGTRTEKGFKMEPENQRAKSLRRVLLGVDVE